jgi:hypothetical protein
VFHSTTPPPPHPTPPLLRIAFLCETQVYNPVQKATRIRTRFSTQLSKKRTPEELAHRQTIGPRVHGAFPVHVFMRHVANTPSRQLFNSLV